MAYSSFVHRNEQLFYNFSCFSWVDRRMEKSNLSIGPCLASFRQFYMNVNNPNPHIRIYIIYIISFRTNR